jgi:hypothetical protein
MHRPRSTSPPLVACRSEFVTEFGCPTLAASLFLPLEWEAAALVRYLCDSPLAWSRGSIATAKPCWVLCPP